MMDANNKNPYAILGLLPCATVKQIRKAYCRLAMKHHPDKSPNDPEAEKKFMLIQAAYESLCKHKKAPPVPSDGGPQTHPFADSADPFPNFFMKLRSHSTKKK